MARSFAALVCLAFLLAFPLSAQELNGIALGMTREQVTALHGPPDARHGDTWVYRYSWPEVQTRVAFDSEGRVLWVEGCELTEGGELLLQRDSWPDEVEQVLAHFPNLRRDRGRLRLGTPPPDSPAWAEALFQKALESQDPGPELTRLAVALGPDDPMASWILTTLRDAENPERLAASFRQARDEAAEVTMLERRLRSEPDDPVALERLAQLRPPRRSGGPIQIPDPSLWQEKAPCEIPWLSGRVAMPPDQRREALLLQELFSLPREQWEDFLVSRKSLLTGEFLARCGARASLKGGFYPADTLDFRMLEEVARRVTGQPPRPQSEYDLAPWPALRAAGQGCLLGTINAPGPSGSYWQPQAMQPCPGLTVVLDGGDWITRTDDRGAFSLWNLTPGAHWLTVGASRHQVWVPLYPQAGHFTNTPRVGSAWFALSAEASQGLAVQHPEVVYVPPTPVEVRPREGFVASYSLNPRDLVVRQEPEWQLRARVTNLTGKDLSGLHLTLRVEYEGLTATNPLVWKGKLPNGATVDLDLPTSLPSWRDRLSARLLVAP